MSTTIATLEGTGVSVVTNEARISAPRQRSPGAVVKRVWNSVKRDLKKTVGWIYSVPCGGSVIRGPSVRLAEVLRYYWGGIWIEEVYVKEYENYVEAKVVGVDVITGNLTSAIAVESILDGEGKRYEKPFLILNAKRSALAKAKRNVILDLVPRATVTDRIIRRIRAMQRKYAAKLKAKFYEKLDMLALQEKKPRAEVVTLLEKLFGVKAKEGDKDGDYSPDFMLTVLEYAGAIEDGFANATEGQTPASPPESETVSTSSQPALSAPTTEPETGQLWGHQQVSNEPRPMKVRPLRR